MLSQEYAITLKRLLGSRDWKRALTTAQDWLAEDPQCTAAHRAAGQALVNLKHYAQAQVHIQKALVRNPHDGFAHHMAANACFEQGKSDAADEHMQQALALQPNNASHWYQLAWMRHRQGAFDLAAKYAARSLELQPCAAHTLNLLAACERQNAKAQLAYYQRALEVDPENSTVHNNLGGYYLQVYGDYVAAEESFRRALLFSPTDETARRNLFKVLQKRDVVYQLLHLPLIVVEWALGCWRIPGWRGKMILLCTLLLLGYVFVPVLMAAFLMLYPPMKAYEQLTLGEIRAQAGEPGARRGGFLGFRRWPYAVRFGLLATVTLMSWFEVLSYTISDFVEGGPSFRAMQILALLITSIFGLIHGLKRALLWWIVKRSEQKLN